VIGMGWRSKMIAERFATVKNSRIVTITEANPPQELKEGQFSLSKMEWDLLHYLPLLPDGKGIDIGLEGYPI
jgi:hypothetical protein